MGREGIYLANCCWKMNYYDLIGNKNKLIFNRRKGGEGDLYCTLYDNKIKMGILKLRKQHFNL